MQVSIWRFSLLVMFFGSLSSNGLLAEDWPQWMGPNRDNYWNETGIVDKFEGPVAKAAWRVPVAIGYAGPAIANGRVYLMDLVTKDDVKISNFERKPTSGREQILCFDAATGKELWKLAYDVDYAISYPSGPRCTPIIEGNKGYFLGAEGMLHCLNLADGAVVWKRNLKADYRTNSALWGYASHPLIDGERLICLVGGEGSHAVAFNKDTGAEIWKYGTASEQGYSPPKIIEAAGVRQLLLMSPDYLAAVNPADGNQLWKEPYKASNGSIIMTPVHVGDHVFIGGYSRRNLMVKLDTKTPNAETLFRDETKKAISPVNVQPIVVDEVVYGVDSDGSLTAFVMPSGKRLWRTGQPLAERGISNGTVFIVKNADRFFMFTEQGDLILAKMSKEGFQEIDRTHVLEPTNNAFGRKVVWSAPGYANGKMYVRNDSELVCIDLRKAK